MSAIRTLITKQDKKITIAFIGLVNAGKTEFVKRILQSNEFIHATLINNPLDFEIHILGNMSFLTWDLIDTIPSNKTLWKHSIIEANALFFLIDSTQREKFPLNKALIAQLVEENSPIRILILGTKSDLPTSASVGELFESLNLVALDKRKCEFDLFKFSAKTGEGISAIEEWLNITLFKQEKRVIDDVKIYACVSLNEDDGELIETIFTKSPTINLMTSLQELKRKVKFFSRIMRTHEIAEEVIEIGSYKVILVKEKNHIIALMVHLTDSVPRVLEISKGILPKIDTSVYNSDFLKKTISKEYLIDFP